MSESKLEQEAKRFLQGRDNDGDVDKLRKELIILLERFLQQLKNKGA